MTNKEEMEKEAGRAPGPVKLFHDGSSLVIQSLNILKLFKAIGCIYIKFGKLTVDGWHICRIS
jgi:hypothetical protein